MKERKRVLWLTVAGVEERAYNEGVLIGACTVRFGSGVDTIAVAMNFLVVD